MLFVNCLETADEIKIIRSPATQREPLTFYCISFYYFSMHTHFCFEQKCEILQ